MGLASSMLVRRMFEKQVVCRGVSFVTRAKNLGVDQLGAGPIACKGRSSAAKRFGNAWARRSKLKYAAKHGGMTLKVAMRGICLAVRYGHKTLGLAPMRVRQA